MACASNDARRCRLTPHFAVLAPLDATFSVDGSSRPAATSTPVALQLASERGKFGELVRNA
jgi:hypothetical protein